MRGQMLTATVPFSFHVKGAEMPAGQYSVSRIATAGAPVLHILNQKAHRGAIVMASGTVDTKAGSPPRIVFRCTAGVCSLAEIWGATASPGVVFNQPKGKSDDVPRLAVVYFDQTKNGH